jgi:hypothetical protein
MLCVTPKTLHAQSKECIEALTRADEVIAKQAELIRRVGDDYSELRDTHERTLESLAEVEIELRQQSQNRVHWGAIGFALGVALGVAATAASSR